MWIAEVLHKMNDGGFVIMTGSFTVMVPGDRKDIPLIRRVLSIELSVVDCGLILGSWVRRILVLVRDIAEMIQKRSRGCVGGTPIDTRLADLGRHRCRHPSSRFLVQVVSRATERMKAHDTALFDAVRFIRTDLL